MAKKTVVKSFRINEDMLVQLESVAERYNTSLSNLVSEILLSFLLAFKNNLVSDFSLDENKTSD